MHSVDLIKARANAKACAERLTLPLNSKVWRGQAGEFAGAGVGSSLDFQDHRTYAPGDDPRHINWQAYARTGAYTMKLYREEVRPVVDVVFDVSESMFFDAAKAQRAIEVFYSVCFSALQAGASLMVQLVAGQIVKVVPNELLADERWWSIAEQMIKESEGEQPMFEQLQVRASAIRVLVSDVLFPGDPTPLLRRFTARHGSLIILSPYCREESDPAWSGNYDFVDVESGSQHPHCIDSEALEAYKLTYSKHFQVWKSSAQRFQVQFARVAAEPNLLEALLSEAVPTGGLQLK